MKHFFLSLSLLFFCISLYAQQKKVPIIRATSNGAYFEEGKKKMKLDWGLEPDIELDIYRTNKIQKSGRITFYTDIESLSVKLKPGDKYNFIVVLNDRDTCRTQIVVDPPEVTYADTKPGTHDTIPFELTAGNNLKIKALLNGKDTLDLHFDTGGSNIVLTHDAIANKTSLLEYEEEGYEIEDYKMLKKISKLQIGNIVADDIGIFPVTLTPKGTDGHFGWDIFDGRVVELDYDKSLMIIHSSLPKRPKGYAKMKIEYINTLLCLNGALEVKGKKYENRFLFDTGYQRAVLLDSMLMKEQNFPKNDLLVIKTTSLRNSLGKVFYTNIVESEKMIFKNAIAENIPTQLLNRENPARFKTHLLGNELLKRFNAYLDFQKGYIYLKANGLMGLPYADAS